jgi:hydrogenase nickel incorporation protein HypA/HybF
VHEWSLVESLLAAAEREARSRGARSIHRVHLRIGELSGVEIPLLETAYETFRERTLCADAPLAIERVAARWACPRCDRDVARSVRMRCEGCDAPAQLAEGDEIVLSRIELEIAPAHAAGGEAS